MKEIVLGLVSVGIFGSGLVDQQKEITYHQTIAPLIHAKCLPCHSSYANVGPFDFSTYQSVTSRIELIRNQILAQNMPPVWAHSDYGKLANIEQFTDEEAVLLQKWIQQKMPVGIAPKDWVEPTKFPKVMSAGYPGRPSSFDLSFAKGLKVRSEGLPYWSVVSCDLPKKGGRIDVLDLVPKNPRVIRYATLAIVPKDMKLSSETGGSMDLPGKYLVGVWAPGYPYLGLPNNMSRFFSANSKLVAQVHYRPTGKPENAEFKVEVYNIHSNPKVQPSWMTLEDKDVFIPAGKSKVVELTRQLDRDVSLISVLPEARFYAGRVQLQFTPKDGKPKTVFDDMRWDPYWIGNFTFAEPVKLSNGGTLTARFYYDNDEFCRVNEGKKPKPISAGPTASDEVCRLLLLVGP